MFIALPLFFIVPFWALCIVLGLIFILFARTRFLSLYLLVCSTLGLLLSIVFPLLVFLIATLTKLGQHSPWDTVMGVIMILSSPLGFLVGAAAGFFLARFANRKSGWQKKSGANLQR